MLWSRGLWQKILLGLGSAPVLAGSHIVEDVSRLYARITACEATAVCGFVNLPIVALLFTPHSAFSLEIARGLFALLSFLYA